MTVPQAILDALGAVQSDADDLAAKRADTVAKQQALLQAQQDAAAAQTAEAAAASHLDTDREQLVQMIQAAYQSAAPVNLHK